MRGAPPKGSRTMPKTIPTSVLKITALDVRYAALEFLALEGRFPRVDEPCLTLGTPGLTWGDAVAPHLGSEPEPVEVALDELQDYIQRIIADRSTYSVDAHQRADGVYVATVECEGERICELTTDGSVLPDVRTAARAIASVVRRMFGGGRLTLRVEAGASRFTGWQSNGDAPIEGHVLTPA